MKFICVNNCLGHEFWINTKKIKYLKMVWEDGAAYTRIYTDDGDYVDVIESLDDVLSQIKELEHEQKQ